jgi:hypothetical protein
MPTYVYNVIVSRLLNLSGEIGSGYPSMSMIVIDFLLPILKQRWRCLLYDVFLTACWLLYNGIEIPGMHFQYQNRKYTE